MIYLRECSKEANLLFPISIIYRSVGREEIALLTSLLPVVSDISAKENLISLALSALSSASPVITTVLLIVDWSVCDYTPQSHSANLISQFKPVSSEVLFSYHSFFPLPIFALKILPDLIKLCLKINVH